MSENTEATTTPQEPAELQGDGGIPFGHIEDDPKKALFDVLWKAVKDPEVKEASNPEGVAFAVCQPQSDKVLCYCTCKKDAEFIAHAVGLAAKVALSTMVLR